MAMLQEKSRRDVSADIVLLGCLAALSSCSIKDPFVPEPPTVLSATAVIDQSGGILTIDGIDVVVPADAVAVATVLTIKTVEREVLVPANLRAITKVFSLEPLDIAFAEPVTFVFHHTIAPPTGNIFSLELVDMESGAWGVPVDLLVSGSTSSFTGTRFGTRVVVQFQPLNKVYVSNESRGAFAAGTKEDPLPDFASAARASIAAGDPVPEIYVAGGLFAVTAALPSGFVFHGSRNPTTWAYDPSIPTVVSAAEGSVLVADVIQDAPVATTLSNIRFSTSGVDINGNSISVVVAHLDGTVTFDGCSFHVQSARAGADGQDGTNGTAGSRGTGQDDGLGCYTSGQGAYAGGDGGCRPTLTGAWTRAEPGQGPLGGAAGAAEGEDGQDGGGGTSGANGSAGGLGSVLGSTWLPGRGSDGTGGTRGSGGGGGEYRYNSGGHYQGGGGGGGGWGGLKGLGGSGGGSSICVLVIDSAVAFRNCGFIAGNGGTGGAGGSGGRGGSGGDGGLGYKLAGAGGNGGTGGHGGGGQGGPGGFSCGVLVSGSIDPVLVGENEFTIGNPGIGGSGGRLGGTGAAAPNGAAGIAQDIISLD